jgi:hypothetical protein
MITYVILITIGIVRMLRRMAAGFVPTSGPGQFLPRWIRLRLTHPHIKITTALPRAIGPRDLEGSKQKWRDRERGTMKDEQQFRKPANSAHCVSLHCFVAQASLSFST